jgi:hypothetical protein
MTMMVALPNCGTLPHLVVTAFAMVTLRRSCGDLAAANNSRSWKILNVSS